jgi:hypothetical protein
MTELWMNPSNLMVWWWVLGSLLSSISMHHVVHFNPLLLVGHVPRPKATKGVNVVE